MPSTDTINAYQGESIILVFHHTSGENLADWDIRLSVKTIKGDTQVITKGAVIIDGAAGDYSITIDDTDTDLLPLGKYKYGVWRMDDETMRPLAVGRFNLLDGVKVIEVIEEVGP